MRAGAAGRAIRVAAFAVTMLAARPGSAQGPTPQSEEFKETQDQDTQAQEPKREKRVEAAILPALSVSSDTGIGLGAFSQFTRYLPGQKPYAWLLQVQAKMSVKDGPFGVEFPTHEHFIRIDKPGLAGGKLRVYSRLGFDKNIIAGWYGLGNQSSADKEGVPRRFQYRSQGPQLALTARYAVWRDLSVFSTLEARHFHTETYAGSRLEEDIAASEDGTGERIVGTDPHFLGQFQAGAIWDDRDHETSPTRGSFHELSVRGSPGGLTGAEHNFVGVNASSRNFYSIIGEVLVFGFRVAGDVLQGDVPYYFLGEAQGLRAVRVLGSELGVRGVPARRYNGKVKVFANTELRSVFHRFTMAGEHFALGASVFFDTGRVWYDLAPHPELDGTRVGLKYGVGGGPQIHWGEALVIRVDTAYSPDANPIGFYLEAGRAF